MWLIGLTGGSGSGKTTAAKLFSEYGVVVIDADEVARFVVRPNSAALTQIGKTFGSDYLLEDGTLNRAKLGSLVFSDKDSLERLNGIMIPQIMSEIELRLENLREKGVALALLDAPLLHEYHLDEICDSIVLMMTPTMTRVERLMKRDGLSRTEIEKRLLSQTDYSLYAENADYILDATDASVLQNCVSKIVTELQRKANA